MLIGDIPEADAHAIVSSLGYRALPVGSLIERKLLMERQELRLQDAGRRVLVSAALSVPVTVIAMADWKQLLALGAILT